MVLSKTCVVFEIVSLKGLNKFDQIIFFPVTFWVKDFIRHYGKEMRFFHFESWLSFVLES